MVQAKVLPEKERLAMEKKGQLGRMYGAMPSEEAAEILCLVKLKLAGVILGHVKPERGAKSTEQFPAQTRK